MKKKSIYALLAAAMLLSAGCAGMFEDVDATEESVWMEDAEANCLYWLSEKEWDGKADLAGLALCSEDITLPVNMESLDAYLSVSSDMESSYNISSFASLGDCDTSLASKDEIQITVNEDDSLFGRFYVKNYSDTDLSVSDCYENGWWRIMAYSPYEDMFLLDEEYDFGADELNAIVDCLGCPSYIYMDEDSASTLYSSEGAADISYTLVYEDNDFTLEVGVNDIIESGENTVQISYVCYYSAGAWENEYSGIEDCGTMDLNGVELKVYNLQEIMF